jgi:hypothetical protein
MNTKYIEQIISPGQLHWVGDGFHVHTFFPEEHFFGEHRMSPFFLLDYNAKMQILPSEKERGVGVHPHRGFETVTLAYHGKVAHHDSAGNSGVIGEGDVQWMTAASGVLHKEYYEKEFNRQGGVFQMVQLWVNLPAKDKLSKPKYQSITREQMSKVLIPGNGGVVDVVAGNLHGIQGSASTFTPIELYNIRLNVNGKIDLAFPATYNTGIVVIQGKITINHNDVANENEFVLFKNEGEEIALQANEESIILLLSGQPINEPIASYGPFLMNTRKEIAQAFDDFNSGEFGYLEE